MARKDFADGSEDTQALKAAYSEAVARNMGGIGKLSARDMIMAFDGSKGDLATALSELKGTKRASEMKNIDRWLAYEKGDRGKQARNVERSRATQDKLKELFARRNPPRGQVSASITGWIGYNGDWRYRSIDIPAMGKSVDTEAFNAAMQAGDTRAAMQALFDAYAPAVTVAQADSFTLTYEEEE